MITLSTMAPRRNVLRCFWIWFSAHTLTCYVGRCWVTHLHAKRFWQSGFIEEQGVRAKPPPEGYRLPWSTAESCPDCRSVVAWVLSSTCLEMAGRGGEHLRDGGARVQWHGNRAAKRPQDTAAGGGTDAGACAAVWTTFVIMLWFGGSPRFRVAGFRFYPRFEYLVLLA